VREYICSIWKKLLDKFPITDLNSGRQMEGIIQLIRKELLFFIPMRIRTVSYNLVLLQNLLRRSSSCRRVYKLGSSSIIALSSAKCGGISLIPG
jgi:hypothetical protein